jgi:hypothetical protein
MPGDSRPTEKPNENEVFGRGELDSNQRPPAPKAEMVGQLGAAADRCPDFFLVIRTIVTAGGNPEPLPIVSRLQPHDEPRRSLRAARHYDVVIVCGRSSA